MEARRYPKNSTKAFEICWACGKNEQWQVPHIEWMFMEWEAEGNRRNDGLKLYEKTDEMKVDLHTATHMAHDRRQWRESVNELLKRVDETSPRQQV